MWNEISSLDGEISIPSISVRQPWAELILRGVKSIEIRTWTTSYRGDLYLHTGKMADGYKIFEYDMANVFRGGYIGIIELVSILEFTHENWRMWQKRHLSNGSYRPGCYAWVLRNPRRFEQPISGPGKLNLFYPDPLIADLLRNSEIKP